MKNNDLISKKLVGRPFWQAPIMAARISCNDSIAHNIAAVKTIESASGIEISGQTEKLRKLVLATEIIKNHTNNLYFDILPELLGLTSADELSKTHPELFKKAVKLREFAGRILTTVTGRAIHPITSVVGGFKSYPSLRLGTFLPKEKRPRDAGEMIEIADGTLRLFAGFDLPKPETKSDFAALHDDKSYAFYDGDIWTSKGKVYVPEKFSDFAESKNDNILTGPIARYSQNHSRLDKKTQSLLEELEITSLPGVILSQAIELYEFVILSIMTLDRLIVDGIKNEHVLPPRLSVANGTLSVPPQKFSTGTSAVESADGLIIHSCELDQNGIIEKYDIFAPDDL